MKRETEEKIASCLDRFGMLFAMLVGIAWGVFLALLAFSFDRWWCPVDLSCASARAAHTFSIPTPFGDRTP